MPVPAVVAAILAFIAKRGSKAAIRKYGKKAVEEAKERKKEAGVRRKEAGVRRKEAEVRRKEAEKRIQEGKKSREKQDVQIFEPPPSPRKKLEDIAPVPVAAESIDVLRKKREEGFRKGGKVERSKPKVRGAGIARKGVRPAKMY